MSSASTFLMLLRLGFSLAFVFGMIWFAARFAKKQGGLRLGGVGSSKRIEVLDRQSITRHASVAVISIDGRAVLLGVTDQTVTLLGDAPELDASAEDEIAEPREVDLDQLDLDQLDLSSPTAPSVIPSASRRTGTQTPTRMNFLDALRDRSVRR